MTTRITHRPLTLTEALSQAAAALVAAFRRQLKIQRDMDHLNELPDYLLEDVGLTRADLRPHSKWPGF